MRVLWLSPPASCMLNAHAILVNVMKCCCGQWLEYRINISLHIHTVHTHMDEVMCTYSYKSCDSFIQVMWLVHTSHVTRSYKSCDSVIQVMWLVRVCITYSANCTCRQKSTENANPKVLTVKVRVTYSTSKIQLIKTSKHLRCDFVSTVVVTVWHGVVTSTQCVITCTARGHTGLSHEHVIKARWGKVVRVGPAGRRHKKGLKKCTQVKVT